MSYPQAALEDVKSSLWKAEESLTEALRKLDLLIDFRPYLEIKIKPNQRWKQLGVSMAFLPELEIKISRHSRSVQLKIPRATIVMEQPWVENTLALLEALFQAYITIYSADVIYVQLSKCQEGRYSGKVRLCFSQTPRFEPTEMMLSCRFIKEGATISGSSGSCPPIFDDGFEIEYPITHSLQFQNKD